MMIRSQARLALFAVLCTVVLLPRLGGPHLHLCLDGSAPPVALHLSDTAGNELNSGTDDGHNDHTVDVSNPILGKVWPPGLDGALLLIVVVLLGLACQALLLPWLRTIPVRGSPRFLRPPLRAPPA
jgi:hypothetical protein